MQGITDHRRRRADAEHRTDVGDVFGVCCGRCVVIGLCSAFGVGRFDDIGDCTTRGKETDRSDDGFGYGDAGGRRDEYRHDLVVTSEVQSYDLTLTRAVATFRMVLTDEEIPSTVTKFKFYYTGGSSTFSPSAGYGCVNSKQTEIRTVADGGVYEIFTLPHTEEDVLTKLTVTALDANDNTVKERVFENVPVNRNQITRYTGSFFGNGGCGQTSDGTFRLTADPDWDSVNGYTF